MADAPARARRVWIGLAVVGAGAGVIGLGLLLWRLRNGGPMFDDDRAPYFEGRRPRRRPPRFIVIHHSATRTAKATARVLTKRGLSTHFEVERDGRVIRYLDPAKDVALHALWANNDSIGIDVTHPVGGAWPRDQVKATAHLVRALKREFNLPEGVAPDGVRYSRTSEIPADVGVLRHRNVRPTACPADFPMDALGPVMPSPALV